MKKLLIATTNPGKAAEYKNLLQNFPIEIVTLKETGIEYKVEEDGKTFEENAVKKAREYSEVSGLPTLADDGGLEIDYLNGEPGVLSRRWAEAIGFGGKFNEPAGAVRALKISRGFAKVAKRHEASDEELIGMTLAKLAGVPWEKRTAKLRVVIALKFPGEDKVYIAEGVKSGFIRKNPLNPSPGYPFRCLFYIPELGKTYSELTSEEEIKIAHRVEALKTLGPIIKEKLC